MAEGDNLKAEIRAILATNWKERAGRVVPDAEDVQLGNDAVILEGAVLYADLAGSTQLVSNNAASFAAEIYKSFLVAACRVINANDGVITAFDGDRVMAVFIDQWKNTKAARCALQINYAVKRILVPEVRKFYPSRVGFELNHAVGVDSCSLFIARTGVRGSNDLVWVGNAANWAAKMSALREENYASWISQSVYERMNDSSKVSNDGRQMWEQRTWLGKTIYRSCWDWVF